VRGNDDDCVFGIGNQRYEPSGVGGPRSPRSGRRRDVARVSDGIGADSNRQISSPNRAPGGWAASGCMPSVRPGSGRIAERARANESRGSRWQLTKPPPPP